MQASNRFRQTEKFIEICEICGMLGDLRLHTKLSYLSPQKTPLLLRNLHMTWPGFNQSKFTFQTPLQISNLRFSK